jgi:hypothetical protein
MSWVVDLLIDSFGADFSHIDFSCVGFVSETFLAENKAKRIKKLNLPGRDTQKETGYFFENARALAVAAKQKSDEIDDTVIAVLFRDSDGTASAGRGQWTSKLNSILDGFEQEEFKEYGVAMIPNPKSEAWLLCAVKDNPYQHCQQLENESGNDKGQNPLKAQLSDVLLGKDSAEQISDMIKQNQIDVDQINMQSFDAFKDNLKQVVKSALGLPLGD